MNNKYKNGFITKVIKDKKFGFIQADDGEEYFWRLRDFTNIQNIDEINERDNVTFFVKNSKNKEAEQILKIITLETNIKNEKLYLEDISDKYKISIDKIISIAKTLNISNVYNKDSYIWQHNIDKIIKRFREENNKKSNDNNSNQKLTNSKQSVLLIDYIFAYKVLGQYNFVDNLMKLLLNFKINHVELILDDNIEGDNKHSNILDEIVKRCKKNNIKGSSHCVERKNTKESNSQRADNLVSQKLGEYSAKEYEIYFLSGDSDFVPVLENIGNKATINLFYYKKGEINNTKYSYTLLNLFKDTKKQTLNKIDLNDSMKEIKKQDTAHQETVKRRRW